MAKQDSDINRLRADLASNRMRLNQNIEGLVAEVHPTALKRKAVTTVKTEAKEKAQEIKSSIVGIVYDESGPRWDRIGTGALAVTGVVVLTASLRGMGRLFARKVFGG
ncbi:hypothetical protein [Propionibacterium sp.]|uniref:hypothetical protein n=1 Tax=Propionibacterium sp. TaxID=1977903 RepID=UPI0039E90951